MPVTLVTLVVFSLAGCKSSGTTRERGGGGCCRGNADHALLQNPNAGLEAENAPLSSGQANYGGQKTCPVMAEELGSMGPAIPVTVKGQTIYVCCRGCASRVQRDPDAYLAKVDSERKQR